MARRLRNRRLGPATSTILPSFITPTRSHYLPHPPGRSCEMKASFQVKNFSCRSLWRNVQGSAALGSRRSSALRRLVADQDPRLGGQRARDGDALPLSARELVAETSTPAAAPRPTPALQQVPGHPTGRAAPGPQEPVVGARRSGHESSATRMRRVAARNRAPERIIWILAASGTMSGHTAPGLGGLSRRAPRS